MLEIQLINRSPHKIPEYATKHASGMELRAWLKEPVALNPGSRRLVQTGLSIALPIGYEAQIRPRSGLALKHGITVLNSPGTIDADYRGEISILLVNLSETKYYVENGHRIAQLVIAKYESIQWKTLSALDATERGAGGYGSTGTH